MPEGDVVARTAARLDRALRDEPLVVAELRWGELGGVDLVGRSTLEVVSRGKHLLHRLSGGLTLHSHLRMEGSWHIAAPSAVGRRREDPQLRALLGSARWWCLGLRLGMLDLIDTGDEDRVVGHLGPDLLDPGADVETALTNVRADPTRPLAEALLDQRNLAGLGTFYVVEACFLARVNPWIPVGELSDPALAALVARARRLLEAGRSTGHQSTTGSTLPHENAYVHARSGRPCRRCGDTVRVAPLGTPPHDRVLFSCPTCQGGLAPTDDGAPQAPLGAGRRPGRRRR